LHLSCAIFGDADLAVVGEKGHEAPVESRDRHVGPAGLGPFGDAVVGEDLSADGAAGLTWSAPL
jgi:hypothetical protein